jgi:carbonic anhydrase/acetyltransferase-like protein (isoleucine patch superfamily)
MKTETSMIVSNSIPHTALLFADWPESARGGLQLDQPNGLLPVHGKPMLQRSIEQLARLGCKQVHLIIGEDVQAIRSFLQSGQRWGCQVSYHYRMAQEPLAQLARRLNLPIDEEFWLADAERLPDLKDLQRLLAECSAPVCTLFTGHNEPRWLGWARVSGDWLIRQNIRVSHAAFGLEARGQSSIQRLTAQHPSLSVRHTEGLLGASETLFAQGTTPVVISKRAMVDPSAELIAPVYIADQVFIGPNCRIGPDVSIERGSFIGRGTHIRDSLVLDDTYVGQELELTDVIVKGSQLINRRLKSQTDIPSPWILAPMPQGGAGQWRPIKRLQAWGLRVLLWPLWKVGQWRLQAETSEPTLIAFPRGPQQAPGQITVQIQLPELLAHTPHFWLDHFVRTFYPGLREIGRGHVQLVGPRLRSLRKVRTLPAEWQDMYRRHRAGLLQDSLLEDPHMLNPDLHLAADALASAGDRRLRANLPLLGRYLGRVLRASVKPGLNLNIVSSAPIGQHSTINKPAAPSKSH